MLSAMLVGSIVPLVVLAIAAAAFGNEVEDRTLANLTLSPVPRWQIALPKLLATITIAAPFIALSALLDRSRRVPWRLDGDDRNHRGGGCRRRDVRVAVRVAGAGERRRPSASACSTSCCGRDSSPGSSPGVRLLSIRHYAIALMHGLDERRFAGADHPSPAVALILVTLVIVGFSLLSVRHLRKMDVP